MTRQVPTDQPLSDEDRQYLKDRGQYATIESIDRETGSEDVAPSGNLGIHGTEPSLQADRTEGAGVGEAQALLYTDPTAQPDNGDESDEDKDYDNWTKDDLVDEAEARGLAKSGTKADLADRLREDDEQRSAPPEDDADDDDDDEDEG